MPYFTSINAAAGEEKVTFEIIPVAVVTEVSLLTIIPRLAGPLGIKFWFVIKKLIGAIAPLGPTPLLVEGLMVTSPKAVTKA